jgi:alpha-galactosidase
MSSIRLDGAHVSLLLLARAEGLPEIVHWGRRLPDGVSADEVAASRARGVRRNAIDEDYVEASLLPTAGGLSLRQPGLQAHRQGRDWTAWFQTRSIEHEAGRIVVEAVDEVAKLSLTITLELAAGRDVLTMRSSLRNDGDETLDVLHLAAGTFLVPAIACTLLSFDGHWGREFFERRVLLETGRFVLENRRGRTSHDRHPALIVGTDGFNEESGDVWGVHLGWSGNHTTSAEVLEDGALLISTGELLQAGEVRLAPGERLQTPVAHAGFSSEGLSGLSRALHAHVRADVVSWPEAEAARPVTLNTWEGNYFDHDLDRLKRQADAAQRLGIERFLLDDGWMRGRDHERAGLGDWSAEPRKYPDGLGPLISHVRVLGMQFGLWVEPEMVNPDSDLFRAFPDAVLRTEGRRLVEGRRQLVLDLGREEIAARIFDDLDALLRAHPIAALKWDMNRDLIAASGRDGAAAYRRHVQAAWGLIDRLRAAHPSVEIESCASGGGRADYGVLARTHRVWASDCTDALERLSIQRGLSRWLPPELMGAHVSASPNHQTGRLHTIGFRAAVALFFHFGVEMDPLTLTSAETEALGGWITLHKRLRPLLHGGLHQGAMTSDGRSLRGVVSADRAQAAYLVAQEIAAVRRMPSPARLPGLDAEALYRVALPAPQEEVFAGGVFSGAVLSVCGLCLPVMQPETAMVLELTRVS